MALDHYPPLALSGAFFPVIASLIAGLVIILRIMMENKYGMISTSIVGNYTLDNPTSFTGKITWDLIGNISWDETELSAIREVAVIYPPGTLAHPKDHITLSRMSTRQKKLAQALEIGETLGQIG
jgi:hypothetical protein